MGHTDLHHTHKEGKERFIEHMPADVEQGGEHTILPARLQQPEVSPPIVAESIRPTSLRAGPPQKKA